MIFLLFSAPADFGPAFESQEEAEQEIQRLNNIEPWCDWQMHSLEFRFKNITNKCQEYNTEQNLINNPEPCVPGDWHCELQEGHQDSHEHTHTIKWNCD